MEMEILFMRQEIKIYLLVLMHTFFIL